MPNSIELAKQFVPILDEVYKTASLTAALDGSQDLVRQGANANELIIPMLSMQGLAKYDRNSGYAHGASAPDHEPIQGKQYSDADFERLNASLVRRNGTLNCGHAAFPIILGVNEPQYTPQELEQLRQENEDGVWIEGREAERAAKSEKTQKTLANSTGGAYNTR